MHMPITIEGDEYLSTEEAHIFLGVSRSWFISKIVPEYKLVPKKRAVGRTLYYRKKDLEPLLDFHDVEPGTGE